VVEVDYAVPRERGQVHVLAIGVGKYQARQLRFAERDARQMSDVLFERGADAKGQRGVNVVLSDEKVTAENVENAFDQIALRVEDRPQDTVVVFLAGHTRVVKDLESFCLLLPTYPFTDTAAVPVNAPGARNDAGDTIAAEFLLPYASIASKLSRLRALQRLVIVDSCGAESILEDKRVRAIGRSMEISSRRARTSYLMASRRGEPEFEAKSLRHGLLTFALLRGLAAISTASEPREITELHLPQNADFNSDGLLSTVELDAYVKQALPLLAGILPRLDDEAGAVTRGAAGGAANQKVSPAPHIQAAEVHFDVVPVK
jgi:hypothetical protein